MNLTFRNDVGVKVLVYMTDTRLTPGTALTGTEGKLSGR